MVDQDSIFLNYGFEKCEMENITYGKYPCYKASDEHYYKLTHFSSYYVFEVAMNRYEAEHGIFEDTDLFDDSLNDEELTTEIINWIEKHAISHE